MRVLETVGLKKDFRRNKGSFFVVNGIDFSIEDGEFVHIVGRSGSGKTTFLNLISGTLEASQGEIYIEGQSLSKMNDYDKSWIRNSVLGFIPQSLEIMPNLNVLDNVRLPHFLFEREGDGVERASMLLDMLGIMHLKEEYCNSLSGGELKRVMIARALMNDVKILIADEPTADLDSKTTKQLMEVFTKLNEDGLAIIMVTHEMETLRYGDSIYEMNDGILTKKEKLFKEGLQ